MDNILFQVALIKGVRTLYSDSDEHTANLLLALATEEANKGNQISINEKYIAEHEQALEFLESIPHVNFVHACNLLLCNFNMMEIVNSTPDDLQRKVKGLSLTTARAIYEYFHRDVK